MNNTPQPKKRIEYLDALRGFTMILVVINHVALFCLDVNTVEEGTFHYYLKQFRMPLFFFVSGFVLYKKDFIWNFTNSLKFLKKKVPVQIISPLIFFLLLIYIHGNTFSSAIVDTSKCGYWFTFTLFEFFLIYILLQNLFLVTKLNRSKIGSTLLLLTALVLSFSHKIPEILPYDNFWGLIGITNFIYFLFFVLGTFVRKHFNKFEYLLDNTPIILVCVTFYFISNILSDLVPFFQGKDFIKAKLLAICGIVIIFSLFRKYGDVFTKDTAFAKTLKFIGRRTLDIYLLHYFFIPRNLSKVLPIFADNNIPLIEFAVSLLFATLVIGACLCISCILRLSPTMAYYLFGAKKE